jgi:CheY-specific phosphatase CheX
MNEPVQTLNIREFITRHLTEVFDTMLAKKAEPINDCTVTHHERVCGSVGFGGETISGVVYLHLSAAFAATAAAAMLGLGPEDLSEAEVNDVVGEMTNMLAGGLKSALCDSGAPCAVSPPSIIRGNSFVVEPSPDVERIWLPFKCEQEQVAVEIHVKSI